MCFKINCISMKVLMLALRCHWSYLKLDNQIGVIHCKGFESLTILQQEPLPQNYHVNNLQDPGYSQECFWKTFFFFFYHFFFFPVSISSTLCLRVHIYIWLISTLICYKLKMWRIWKIKIANTSTAFFPFILSWNSKVYYQISKK